MDVRNLPERLAEYFVICGLPKNPRTYDVSKILTHAEEIIAPDTAIDFTRFPEPIVDIKIVSLKEKEEIPPGYTCIKYSVSGKHKANVLLNFGEEACICYRRGRDQPFIKDIDTLGEKQCPKTNAVVLSRTIGGRAADLPSSLTNRLFLSYLRGTAESSIDCLAVTDLCIIIPEKQETCPPAYRQVTEPICISSFRLKAYICYRKSLVKECIISYEPEVLYWYRVPSADCNFSNVNIHDETSKYPLVVSSDKQQSTDPPEMCDQLNKLVDDKTCADVPSESQVAPLDPDIFQVANFCLPWGASIESWSVNQDPPEVNSFTFMLTNEAYQQLYGVALTFYEPYIEELDLHKCYCLGIDPELVNAKSSTDSTNTEYDDAAEEAIAKRQRHFLVSRVGDRVIGVTKTLCILSRWSFTLPFSNFLGFLYSRCLLPNKLDDIPFERYLGYFLFEIPFPDRLIPNVSVDLCAAPILLQRPDDTNASSSSCESFFRLLDNLNVDLIIQLFVQLLTEQKILMSSVRHSVLSDIGEALTCMIFPLKWTVVYIPYIYMGCIHVIQSPSPYLIGMDSRFFDFFRLPTNSGIAYLDLDTNNFKPPMAPGQPTFDSKVLPKKPLKQLKTRLLELKEKIFQMKNTRQLSCKKISRNMMLDCMFSTSNSELAQDELIKVRKRWLQELNEMTQIGSCIKEAFLQFMVHLLKDYRQCLIPVRNTRTNAMFNIEHFLRECADKHTIPFYRALFETQQWTNFVRDRVYASSRDEELDYFDNRIELLLEESESKSLKSSHSHPHPPHHHHHRSRNHISFITMSNLFTIKRSASSSHEQLNSTTNTHHPHHQNNTPSNNSNHNIHLNSTDYTNSNHHHQYSDNKSLSSNASIRDKSDESTDSLYSSDLGPVPLQSNNNNQCLKIIDPPCWPVPEFVDIPQYHQLSWIREYSLGFIPTNINSAILDLLAARALVLKNTTPLSNHSITASIFHVNTDSAALIPAPEVELGVKQNNVATACMPLNSTSCTVADPISTPSSHSCCKPVNINSPEDNSNSRLTTGLSTLMMKNLQLNTTTTTTTNTTTTTMNTPNMIQRFGSFMFIDSSSPLLIRSNRSENTSLIGLTTKYNLPVNNSTILKRTSQELRYTLNYSINLPQTDDYSRAKYLAACAYSIWFMLLPGYLSSVHHFYTDEIITDYNHDVQTSLPQQQQTVNTVACKLVHPSNMHNNDDHSNDDHPNHNAAADDDDHDDDEVMNIIRHILIQSIHVYKTMHNYYKLEIPDQVALRILLVLLYQNRIENFDLMQFINSMDWTSSSSGIANHIYKAYEKELMEHERLEKERLKSTANNHHSHRRSASADTELNPSSDFNSSENTTNIIAPQPLHSSDDLTDLGYSTLNIHETNKTSPEQDWSPIVEDQSKVITAAATTTTTITTTATNNNNNNNNHSMPCATSTEDHQQEVKHGQQSSSVVVVVIGNDHDHSDAKCHEHHRDDAGQSKEHPTNPTTPNINNNNVDDITNVRENTSSQLVNHIVNISGTTAGVGTETPMAANIHNDAVNSNHIDNSSGSRLSDDSCTEDDDDDDEEEEEDGESEHEHPHYGYKLLSSALSKIKRPFLQHYNTPTTTTTTTHTPLSYHTTLYSHHSSIDMTQGSKHALFSKLSRQSFDENSSTMNVMRQSIHHQNFTNTTTTTTTTTNNDNSNHNYNHDYDGDADDVEDKDNEDTNAQAKVSVVYNAFNLFNRSTSDFINRINMNRSLLDWRSLIPSLSTNPTPQSGRRATTTSNCFTGSNFPDQQYLQPEQHQHQHNQQYYSFSPQYHYQQPQSERISRVSWSKQSSSGTGMKTTDSIDHQLNTVNNHSYNVAPKLSDSACVAVHPTLYGTNHDYYYSHENYPINNQNINDYHQLINQFPYDNNYDHENYALDNHHIDQAHQFKDMWIHIAGSLLVGDINRRISPGNTRTIYLQQCLYQQHMYNNNNSSTSLSAIPTTSFSINRSESSHVISTSNTTLESAIVDGKSTTSIPIMVTATTTTTTANSNLNQQQQLTSMTNDQQTSSVVSDSSSAVQSPPILSRNNSNNNNNKESSPSFSTTSTTATTTTTSNDSQFSNINHHYCITHLNIFITTCSICSKCKHYVYDEEIMAGWSTDENDHRTICPFCKTYFIPQLSIRIFGDTSGGGGGGGVASHGYNQSVKLSQNQSTMKHFHTPSISQSLNNLSNVQCDRNDSTESIPVKSYNSVSPGQSTSVGLMEMTFSYLSPFVIRKTLETIIQNEGDECLRCRSIPHSLLNRSGQLTWNLVWLMHRLGLPTHLLDSLPLWMINYQAEQRRKVKFDQANSTTTSHTHHRHHHHHHFGSPHGQNNNNIHVNNNNHNNNNNSTIFTDALYQVRLSPNLPVYISLRWNATHPVRSVMRNSLYKYCFNSKYSDHNTPWSLVNLANAQDTFGQQFISNPAHNNNNNLHLLNKQTPVNALIHCCPIHAIIDYLIIAIKKDDMRWAVDFLIQIRGHLQLNSSLPLIIKQLCTTFSSATPTSSSPTSSSPSLNTTSITSSTTATVPPTSTTQSTFEMKNGKLIRRNRNQQPQCASLQCYAACSENSLYRELLFLIVHALSRTSLDLMSFDEQYKLVYQSFRNSGCTLLTDFDQPPTLMASICRQMLRPLTLRP